MKLPAVVEWDSVLFPFVLPPVIAMGTAVTIASKPVPPWWPRLYPAETNTAPALRNLPITAG
jgi:hypothetical protein